MAPKSQGAMTNVVPYGRLLESTSSSDFCCTIFADTQELSIKQSLLQKLSPAVLDTPQAPRGRQLINKGLHVIASQKPKPDGAAMPLWSFKGVIERHTWVPVCRTGKDHVIPYGFDLEMEAMLRVEPWTNEESREGHNKACLRHIEACCRDTL
ncbi:hypothetical protein H920_03498 [Fukomys damarensis]|uniref:Uncharacterized protein n=1 Tax=Fukomys damarensis TaxID=885580 RepID=A0A091DXS7_FUKDA|nr:hypothetical protein H920_03498 [Fukomys damarensis]